MYAIACRQALPVGFANLWHGVIIGEDLRV